MKLDFHNEADRLRVKQAADRWNVEPLTLAAIVMQESGGSSFAWRPESKYRWLWDVSKNAPFRKLAPDEIEKGVAPADFPCIPGTTRESEWQMQRSSLGLCQVMGATARELGYRGYLTELFDPDINLEYGARFFSKLLSKYAAGAISAYNAGTPHLGSDYENSVMRWKEELRPLFA